MAKAHRRRGIKAMRDGFNEMHAEGQGIWDIKIYSLQGMMRLAFATLAGDHDAGKVMLLLERLTLDLIEAGRTRKPVMCLLCERGAGRPQRGGSDLVDRRYSPRAQLFGLMIQVARTAAYFSA